MKLLTNSELHCISGGEWNYTPPYNPDPVSYRAGIANSGGYTNHLLKEYVGLDITGDDLTYNKLLGITIFAAGITVGFAGIVYCFPQPDVLV